MAQRLGIDSYSLRSQGWDAFQFLEYSAKIGLDNVHFSERRNLESLDPEYLKRLRRRADELELAIEIGFGSFDKYARGFRADLGSGERQMIEYVEAAAVVGSPVVRCFLGSQTEREGEAPFEQHLQECLRVLRAAAPAARKHGVKIAVENHGGVDLLGRELRWLIEEAGPDYVGACLDTGNGTYGGEDPLVTTEQVAEYAVSTHVRDSAVWATEDGAMAQWTVLGQGNTDLKRILAILAEKAPECPVDLEIITGSAPASVPFKDPHSPFWSKYPGMLARDFTSFVAMAEDGRRRGLGPREQVVWRPNDQPPPREWVEQQLRDFETSVDYAKRELGLGVRGR
jgi:sugar phosphate isomerase/epimerase